MNRDLTSPDRLFESRLGYQQQAIQKLRVRSAWPGAVAYVENTPSPPTVMTNQDSTAPGFPFRAQSTLVVTQDLDPGKWVLIASTEIVYYFADDYLAISGTDIDVREVASGVIVGQARIGTAEGGGPLDFQSPGIYQLPYVVEATQKIRVSTYAWSGTQGMGGGAPPAISMTSGYLVCLPG